MVACMDDGKANALGFEMIAGLRSALATSIAENAPLIIAGREGYFCAGFELQIMRSGDRGRVSSLVTQGSLLFQEMFAAPIPVLAACAGHALAGGHSCCSPRITGSVNPDRTRWGSMRLGSG